MNHRRLFVIGSGGHAGVIAETAELLGFDVSFIDNGKREDANFISEADFFLQMKGDSQCHLICGIGSVKASVYRLEVVARYAEFSSRFISIIHPNATISQKSKIGKGVFVGQGAQIVRGVTVGDHAIVNTGAIIDHDCDIGGFTHIGPGCVLSGAVSIGRSCHIGIGSRVIQGCKIADDVTIGAGAVVIRDVEIPGSTWVGVPAKQIKARK